MLKFEKKFRPKKTLLQNNLEQFLDWRFNELERSSTQKEQSYFSVSKTKTNFYKQTKLNFQKERTLCDFSSEERFFPEKKSFMQFWTLPLLGASFLSFLALEKPSGLFSSQSFHSATPSPAQRRSAPLESQNSFGSLKRSTLNFSPTKEEILVNTSNRTLYKTDYPIQNLTAKTVYHNKQENSAFLLKSTEVTDLENLCLFYLNLTGEKLLYDVNTNEYLQTKALTKQVLLSSLQTKSLQTSNCIENLLLKHLYLKNSSFYWNYYPLYSSDTIHNQPKLENFSQKLNLDLSLRKDDYAQNLTKKIPMTWKKNPSLSYLQSNKFFDAWIKDLQLTELKQQLIQTEYANQTSSKIEKSLILQYFEKFLQNFNKHRKNSVYSYENLKTDFGIAGRIETWNSHKRSHKIFKESFFQSFENKYKLSALRFYINQKSSLLTPKADIGKKQIKTFKNPTNSTNLKKQKFKNILKQSLFANLEQNTDRPAQVGAQQNQTEFNENKNNRARTTVTQKVEIFYSLNQALSNTNTVIESKFKTFLYELFLLGYLKNKSLLIQKIESLGPETQLTANERNFLALNKERSRPTPQPTNWKNKPEKFIQELRLYSQFHHIYKTLLTKNPQILQHPKKDLLFSKSTKVKQIPYKNKSMIYFSKKLVRNSMGLNGTQGLLGSKEVGNFFEIMPKQNHLKRTFLFHQTSKFSNTSKSFPEKNQFLKLDFFKRKDIPNFKPKYKATNQWFPYFSLSEMHERLNFAKDILSQNNLKSFSNLNHNFRELNSPLFFKNNMHQFNFKDNLRLPKSEQANLNILFEHKTFFKKKNFLLRKGFSTYSYRKTEKIFRTYLSIKNAKGFENKSSDYFLLKIRKSNKSILNKFQKSFSQNSDKSQVYLMENHKKNVFFLLQKLKKRVQLFNNKSYKLYNSVKPLASLKITKKKFFFFLPLKETFPRKNCINGNLHQERNHKLATNNKTLGLLNMQSFLQNLNMFSFLKKADFTDIKTVNQSKVFEKKKASEKKRRLKKLKLENRRRKKRKRFYPRPISSRFQLYFNFLQKRQKFNRSESIPFTLYKAKQYTDLQKKQQTSINKDRDLKKSLNSLKVSSILDTSYKKVQNLKYNQFSKNIYGQKKTVFQPTVHPAIWNFNNSNLHQKEFYKISNETLTEFERLCWKSYWLRANLKPYIYKIQTSLKRMKNVENAKTNNKISLGFLQYFSMKKDKLEKPRMSHSTPAYFNIWETGEVHPEAIINLKTGVDAYSKQATISLFPQIVSKAEYEKLLYERLNNQIKNVKSQLTVDGQSQARSYKSGRQPIERNLFKPFWNFPYAFQNNYLEPNLVSNLEFTNSNFLNTNFANKGFPTLRLLWACNKTQLFTYQPNNFAQNLWSTYKKREQTKNNKTRKFLSRLSQKLSASVFGNFTKENIQSKYNSKVLTKEDSNGNLVDPSFASAEPGRAEPSRAEPSRAEPSRAEQSSELRAPSSELRAPVKHTNLQNISKAKTIWADKKIQTFGGFVIEKNYGPYLRKLKFKLQEKPISKQEVLLISNQTNFMRQFGKVYPLGDISKPWFETNMENFIQKRQFHFWWSLQAPQITLPFLKGTPHLFSNLEQSFLYNTNFLNKGKPSTLQKELILQAFWLCSCLCHLAIFFSLIRIPEIRSLVKFQVLVLSKLSSAYLIGLFAIYDLFKKYQEKISALHKTFFKISSQHSNSSTLNNLVSTFTVYSTTKKFDAAQTRSPLNTSFYTKYSEYRNSKVKTPIQSTLHSNFIYRVFYGFTKKSSHPSKVKNEKTLLKFATTSIPSQILAKKSPLLNKAFQLLMLTHVSPVHKSYFKKGNGLRTSAKKDRILALLSLSVLGMTRASFAVFYLSLNIFYKFLFQIIDLLEGTLFIFYKFLEKPAEVMVDWIAEVFLIEWTSSIYSYVPEAFDTAAWTSITKLSRSNRFFYGLPFGFLTQRFFLESTQLFYHWLFKADTDLRIRQKKGVIFWDIWSEILVQAAEKYKMNYSSLSTIKEEQELLIENLLEQKPVEKESSSMVLFSETTSIKNSLNNQKPESRMSFGKTENQQNESRDKTTIGGESQVLNQKQNFLTEEASLSSLNKLQPLMKFIENHPSFYNFSETQQLSSVSKQGYFKKNPFAKIPLSLNSNHLKSLKPDFSLPSSLDLLRPSKFGKGRSDKKLNNTFKQTSLQRWSVSQYLTTQGKDTDLFMDIHPPKSFTHVSFLKSYLPAQEILGSLVCDIYAGLFASKVSKNVLIVGAPGMAKSFFIQALAGETELKMVLDNAHRYAFVNGGVPIGMKLLREVFDSIALHTPCLFLLEDIHVIGERRPMLISDDETSKTKELAFGAEQEEVHEKNKLVYQLSKHALSHYKKPYKGDFSLAIPTNHFCYDLFLGVMPPRKRRSGLSTSSPLPVQALESTLAFSGVSSGDSSLQGSTSYDTTQNGQTLLSFLQISVDQVFAPPATSPFNVLLMKEQKKLKPKKIVKELPWSSKQGLSYDQSMILSKNNYSVRVKVALLAETAMKNLSMKLDMITDLLVIIDSVRSNRGFVVFATTHLPALLDPALRRPGRLDETIALPLLPNIQTRFEIFKTQLSSYSNSMDFLDWSLYSGQIKQNENQLSQLLTKNILLLASAKNGPSRPAQPTIPLTINKPVNFSTLKSPYSLKDYPIYSLYQAFQSSIYLSSLWNNPNILKRMLSTNPDVGWAEPSRAEPSKAPSSGPSEAPSSALGARSRRSQARAESSEKEKSVSSKKTVFKRKSNQFLSTGQDKKNSLALSYAQAGQFLTEALILKDHTTYSMKFSGNSDFEEFSKLDRQKFMFQTLYGSSFETKQRLFKLFAAKIAEFFVFHAFSSGTSFFQSNTSSGVAGLKDRSKNADKIMVQSYSWNQLNQINTNPSNSNTSIIPNSVNYWQNATSFLDALFQKRYLYNKNSVVSKMLFFEDNVILGEPPSPPNSSILMPAMKFENYKRTLRDFIHKPGLSINEKLQLHQKQRFLKLLYKIPTFDLNSRVVSSSNETIKQLERVGLETQEQTAENINFYSSFKDLGYLDLFTLRPSSSYAFYKNSIFNRQRFSFLNQWWNGQLAEHNAETTYLSHIDWRSMFAPSSGGDVFIDFPDAEQYYNPRNRRWFLQSKQWSYWLNFETDLRQQISEHFLVECFTQTSAMLHSNREMFDYLAYRFLRNHQLHELDLIQVLVRFYKKKDI